MKWRLGVQRLISYHIENITQTVFSPLLYIPLSSPLLLCTLQHTHAHPQHPQLPNEA